MILSHFANNSWLAELWFFTIALEIGLYLMLDGADLGIGLRSLFTRHESTRGEMLAVVGPIWDANETWLVIAGGTLFGAFPVAYGIILNALYIPVMILIFGLIMRAVSYELYEYARRKKVWGVLFGVGSFLAVLGQGFLAGGLVSGIMVVNEEFAGGLFDWATPITFLLTLGIMVMYICTGSAYLLRKKSRIGSFHSLLYPFSLAVLALGFGAVTVYLLPYLIPPSITIYQAASSAKTLTFMLYGIGPLIPIIFAYNIYLYRVFSQERAEIRDSY